METKYDSLISSVDKLLPIAYRLQNVLGQTTIVQELFDVRGVILDEVEKLK